MFVDEETPMLPFRIDDTEFNKELDQEETPILGNCFDGYQYTPPPNEHAVRMDNVLKSCYVCNRPTQYRKIELDTFDSGIPMCEYCLKDLNLNF